MSNRLAVADGLLWINHRFLPADAIVMSDRTIYKTPGWDFISVCGRGPFGALNGFQEKYPDCMDCEKILARLGDYSSVIEVMES
jgi:hypothetical protein